MKLDDFYAQPDQAPVRYSGSFIETNKKEILAHQKNFRETYRPFFKAKRLLYLTKTHLRKEFHIGQVSAGLGDTVLYSHLPHLIKATWPGVKVFVYETDMAKIVFANNPFMDGFTREKKFLWKQKGSGSDFGSGQFTQMKACFFGLKPCLPKGEIFISPEEKAGVSAKHPKPVATFHAHGKTHASPLADDIWAAVVKEMKKTHYVIQLKSPDETAIEGVDQTTSGIRECMVQQSVADIHVGVDSGFLHTATALNIPAVVILSEIAIGRPLVVNGVFQLVLPQLKGRHLDWLYPQHSYLCVGASTSKAPALTQKTLRMAMNGEIYPFRHQAVWDL